MEKIFVGVQKYPDGDAPSPIVGRFSVDHDKYKMMTDEEIIRDVMIKGHRLKDTETLEVSREVYQRMRMYGLKDGQHEVWWESRSGSPSHGLVVSGIPIKMIESEVKNGLSV